MQPQTQPRKPRNSSKVNLAISVTFHTVLVVSLVYFAARQGYLGKQIQKISVEMVKEKQPEKPKELEKPKVEPPKVEHAQARNPKNGRSRAAAGVCGGGHRAAGRCAAAGRSAGV